jgi:hypothetical protein
MIRATAISQPSTATLAPRLGLAAAKLWRTLMKEVLDPYRPERHYMRGPGPRWRAKHAGMAQAGRSAIN